jgi:hypothetical protein
MRSGLFYLLANFLLFLTVILHMIGFFLDKPPDSDTSIQYLYFLMENLRVDPFGTGRTLSDIYRGFSLMFAVQTFFIAVLNLSLLDLIRKNLIYFRKIVIINFLFWTAILIILINFLVLPTILLIGGVCLLFLICYFYIRRTKN